MTLVNSSSIRFPVARGNLGPVQQPLRGVWVALATLVFLLTLPRTLGAPATITFQNGVNGYAGCQDTYLDTAAPTTPMGHFEFPWQDAQDVELSGGQNTKRLTMRFDVSTIPPTAHIRSARLHLYADAHESYQGSPAPTDCFLHPVTTSWSEDDATWERADAGTAWARTGGDPDDALGCVYVLTVADARLQSHSDTVTVTVASGVVAEAGADKIMDEGGPGVTLDGAASGGVPPYTYAWTPTDGLDDPTSATPTAAPTTTTTYTLTVTDDIAQTDADTVEVVVRPTTAVFADVPVGHWARGPIEAMYREGITAGCDTSPLRYCPDSVVTRAQMAAFICRAAGKTELDSPAATFGDVAQGSQFYGWIERLADPGSWTTPPATGCASVPPRLYCPNDSCLRGQIATFICRAAGKTELDSPAATFSDVAQGSQFYGWIERLADPGSWTEPPTFGCDLGPPRLFCPKGGCTRAEMAYFICRAFSISLPSYTQSAIAGQVSVTATTPVTAATVRAYLNNVLVAAATTDYAGIYRTYRGLPSGSYIVAASKTGYVTQTKARLNVTAGATTYVNFNLQTSAALAGQVTDARTGQAFSGATVNAYLDHVLRATAVTSGPSGAYRMASDLPPGSYVIEASAPAHAPQVETGVALTASETSYVDFRLDGAHGTVPDELAKLATIGRRAGDKFRFVVSGDQHLGYPNFASYLVPLINSVDADFVMLVGDQTNTGMQTEWSMLFGALDQVRTPAVLQIPGNHEYLTTPDLIQQNLGTAGDYYFDHRDWRFICMDDGGGRLAPAQLEWLDGVLAGAAGPTAIFMHEPPAGANDEWAYARYANGTYYATAFDGGAAEFRDLCHRYRVTVVYMGHIHAFDAAYDGPTLYVVTGGGGGITYEFEPMTPGDFFHITVAEVDGQRIRSHTVYVPDYQYYFNNQTGGWQVGNLGVGRVFTLDVSKWESNEGQ